MWLLVLACAAPDAARDYPRRGDHPRGYQGDTGADTGDGDTGDDTGPAETGGADTADTGGTDTGGGDTADPWGDELDCSPGPGDGLDCYEAKTLYRSTVQAAVQQVQADHPDWFDFSDGWPYVLNVEAYMDMVVLIVSEHDLCAIRDPNAGDEIAVKFNNAFAESFDIYSSDGYARSGDPIYTATCAPAWF